MKRFASLAALLALLLTLAACGAAPKADETPAEGSATLEELCGADYQDYIIKTITMQMGNRMDKTPDVVYFPIREKAPLTDYVAIDETTDFTVDEEGHIVILFPAGSVTDEANGEQSFRIPRP
ncbi:RsiV family protein [Oscillibacter sp.]|uniref:RsiV family protein n=1 Tax=Oscillibacter sp. TaxID=1945593 RepID=UPI001B6A5E20|nr:DUF3298 domain-containing protein [Oscillibacter sp.]MBP3510048.1 DUF3298 domain-containing protein [Oscillibacter sp.]